MVLGMQILGAHASDMIAEGTLAVQQRVPPKSSRTPCTPTRPCPKRSRKPPSPRSTTAPPRRDAQSGVGGIRQPVGAQRAVPLQTAYR